MPAPAPDWSRVAAASADPDRVRRRAAALAAAAPSEWQAVDPACAPALAAALAGSNWIGDLLAREPRWLPEIFQSPSLGRGRDLRSVREALARDLPPDGDPGDPRAALETLRHFHTREHLRIGVRDLARLAPMEAIVLELSDLADTCLAAALRIVTPELQRRLGTPWHAGPDGSWQPTGFSVIALGKLGGRELNFSSDVDLLLLYAEEGVVSRSRPRRRSRIPPAGIPSHEYFRQLATAFIGAVSAVTPAGQLYRVDLRLRPEGDAGPLARSLTGIESYYAQWGQTWERLMLLKARHVAGDPALGAEFLDLVQPFRHPRFPAEHLPDEVAAVKRRMERETAEGGPERDVKRGRGGIREIEFIVQALQVLHGGRQPFLQVASTLPALAKLAEYGLIDRAEADALAEAYRFWRDVEHRLQVEENRQTHALPADPAARGRIARLLGCDDVAGLEALRERHAGRVRAAFDRLLAGRSRGPAPGPGLPGDFRAAAAGWEALLAAHGFTDPPRARRLLQTFVEGPGWAHVSARTGQLGLDLIPRILAGCRGSPFPAGAGAPAGHLSDPDRVLARLDRFVTAYGSRAPLYETWIGHPNFFALLLWLFDRSEFLAETAIRVPDLVEDMVRTDRLRRARTPAGTAADLGHGAADPDQRLWIRRYQEAEQMRIGLRSILGLADTAACQRELTHLADACIGHALAHLVGRHRLRSAPFAVMALGRLGGGEMSFGSDLDLLLVAPRRPARGAGHPARFAAELVDLLSGPTDLGPAYTVDLRLRPDGEAGPLVTSPDALETYLRQRAQLWEIQAVTRLRHVAGPAATGAEVRELADALTDLRHGNPGIAAWTPGWRREIGRMLARVHRDRTPPGRDADAIKTGTGGLIAAEFIGRTWDLAHGWREPGTAAALRRGVEAGLAPGGLGPELLGAHAELTRIELVLRRWSGTPEAELPADPAARLRVAVRCGFADADALARAVARARDVLREAAARLLG